MTVYVDLKRFNTLIQDQRLYYFKLHTPVKIPHKIDLTPYASPETGEHAASYCNHNEFEARVVSMPWPNKEVK